jgi:hypothetical protein
MLWKLLVVLADGVTRTPSVVLEVSLADVSLPNSTSEPSELLDLQPRAVKWTSEPRVLDTSLTFGVRSMEPDRPVPLLSTDMVRAW